MHSLPDIQIDIFKFIYIIYQELKRRNEIKIFKKIENMIKTCLLPQNMFYEKVSYYLDKNNNKIPKDKKIKRLVSNFYKTEALFKRNSSDITKYYFLDQNSINNFEDYDENDYLEEEDNINNQEEIENKIEENNKIIDEEVLVIKDEVFSEHLDALFCIFLDWTCDREISSKASETDIDIVIRNINGLELLSSLTTILENNK